MITNVIEYALDKLINDLEDKNDESSNMIKESAKRTKKLIQHIRIYNVEYVGLTFEKFTEQLNEKPNIYLLSDKQLEEIKTIIKLTNILDENGFILTKKDNMS